ncbi:MAG: 4-hydroxythreonine-4-phosphate dehydrogenase PdxA [Bacteroidia bacterium]
MNSPVLAISTGDLNGVGLPLLLKLFSDPRMLQRCTPVLYASGRVLGFYRKELGLQDWTYQTVSDASQAQARKFNLVVCWQDELTLRPGEPDQALARFAEISLRRATEECLAGKAQGLVTLPIDKNLMQSETFGFAGHTEFLEDAVRLASPKAASARSLMWLVADDLRVATLTGHVPLQDVPSRIQSNALRTKINDMLASLSLDFGLTKPRIAVLGLNPHAGDGGLLGREETEILGPTLREMREEGALVFGPYGADGFWGTGAYARFDAVLGMYHDQVLIPFKTLAFERGVNFTGGLPLVRCSPDHGPAFDKAALRRADSSSLLHTLYETIDRIRTRQEQENLALNALKKVSKPKELEQSEGN